MDRKRINVEGMRPVNFYEISEELLPSIPWFPRTENVVTELADLITASRFLVKYDTTTAPLIDAAVMRGAKADEDTLHGILQLLHEDEYIILINSQSQPPVLAELLGDEADYAELITYEHCVEWAETHLNDLLRFNSFQYRHYLLYMGAAFAIVRAEHPDWNYEAFIECCRKDVVERMAERTENYLGYREFCNA